MTQTRKNRGNWIVAIPSYRRAETLRDKTLALLHKYGVPRSKIHVFVANTEEEKVYKETLDPMTYGHLHVAKPGLMHARNYITKHFAVGQEILNMDDDIRGFIKYSATAQRKEKDLTGAEFATAVTSGFKEAHRTGYRLFGFYPVANGYFMRPKTTTDLRYIIGAVWGIVNPGETLKITIEDKEDYLRSVIMYLLDGGVLRFNNIAPETAYYKEPGGMQETRTMKRVMDSAKAMVSAFPDLMKINLTKKSGMPEVRLRDNRPEEERTFGPKALAGYRLPTA